MRIAPLINTFEEMKILLKLIEKEKKIKILSKYVTLNLHTICIQNNWAFFEMLVSIFKLNYNNNLCINNNNNLCL